ncbi:hypothetical protein NM688_g1937 [Phlebia brevispora]|uniref:Uncharacterized protein n=1 Tax=Phlebia brevispora TaxID=194682 RepID=A0ACC1TA99_9APHY|nr:hypothetical protein NM688_g1937 [Phlebia brevispora]
MPNTNILKGDLYLSQVTELFLTYKDVIPQECIGDIELAKSVAYAIREDYEACKKGNVVFTFARRVALSKRFREEANKAFKRTKHITDAAAHNEQLQAMMLAISSVKGSTVLDECEQSLADADNSLTTAPGGNDSCEDGRSSEDEARAHKDASCALTSRNTRYDNICVKLSSSRDCTSVEMSAENMVNPVLSVEGEYLLPSSSIEQN